MLRLLPQTAALRHLSADGRRLFVTRCVRLFGYGLLSVILVLYLAAAGLSNDQIGWLLLLTMIGDTVLSLWITTNADRIGRRRMLILGAFLMVLASVLFLVTGNFWILLLAATIGVISPNGNEVGPFLSIEQAAIAEVVAGADRTSVLAWYNLVGAFATALGSLTGGGLAGLFQWLGWSEVTSYLPVLLAYGLVGMTLAGIFFGLSAGIEVHHPAEGISNLRSKFSGVSHSKGIVAKLSALFAMDAFAGGFVVQSVLAYWFHLRFELEPAVLGWIFFGANIFAGISYLLAAWVASKIGLINTMVFTHLPSNVLLVLVPLMPNVELAITLLLLRFSISQMDVPTRQSYTMAVVRPEERSAANGITSVARSIGSAISPMLAMKLVGSAAFVSWPFFLAGGIKIVYDLALYRSFTALKPDHEK